MTPISAAASRLVEHVASFRRVVVAYSGGVDSAVVAAAAYRALGTSAVAVTAVGPSVARHDRQIAQDVARQIGIRHVECATTEWQNPAYVRNDLDRCFHCKANLYHHLDRWKRENAWEDATTLSGTNCDDLGDFRPGLTAAAQAGIRHPLVDCGLAKSDVRELARYWQLSVWDRPASPCLASRIAYGLEATPERLARIERAEALIRSLGFDTLRVRLHEGELARIEVPCDQVHRLVASLTPQHLEALRALGFRHVTVDLAGFRSGSLHAWVPAETLTASVAGSRSACHSRERRTGS